MRPARTSSTALDDRAQHRARIGIDELERLAHEPEEVLAHPRHAGELRPVRDLVDRDPQPEVGGPERETLLERQDVGADVVDRVGRARPAVVGVVGHEQVVLTEHALREVAEQPAHLGGRDAAADRRERVVREPLAEALHERIEQRPHRRDVRLDPVAPVEHARRRVPGRAQPGVARDEILGADGQRVEVGLQRRGEVRVGERIAAGDEPGDAPGRGPVDGIGRPPSTVAGLAHLRRRPLVSSRPTLTQYTTASWAMTAKKPIASSGAIQ